MPRVPALQTADGLGQPPTGAEWLRPRGDRPVVLVGHGSAPVDADLLAAVSNVPAVVDSVVLAPHTGGATVGTRRAMADLGPAHLARWVADGAARTPIL